MTNQNLTIFLYLLMRDYLPTGEVAKIVKEIEESIDGKEPIFTAKGLGEYAEELAKRILTNA